MTLSLYLPPNNDPSLLLTSNFLQPNPNLPTTKTHLPIPTKPIKRTTRTFISCSSSSCSPAPKIVRSPSLDRYVVKANRIRFVQKLKTLLLSKPKHFLPLHILAKCRSYLSLSDSRSLLSMIHRYPSIFEVFPIPIAQTPFNATKHYYQLCVRLTPAAAALAAEEKRVQTLVSVSLANKVQRLLMMTSHGRLLLSKLVHLAPDLGLPPNFRSRLCNDHPGKFKTVDTSYGRAVELVLWDDELAVAYSPRREDVSDEGLIVDRPLKFNRVRLRKGLNVKRRHQEFLIKFRELPDVCPYKTCLEEFGPESLEAEKRACAVVREILGMTVEKRTLIDHLTHFRKEFGLPNKLRGMIVRHPELFYVSLKGLRDSVFLVEAFDEKGNLLEKDESSVINDRLMELVREAKRMRRERRKNAMNNNGLGDSIDVRNDDGINGTDDNDDDYDDDDDDDDDDGLENLFESEDSVLDFEFNDETDGSSEFEINGDYTKFWTANASIGHIIEERGSSKEPW